jgi:hypothetical protein
MQYDPGFGCPDVPNGQVRRALLRDDRPKHHRLHRLGRVARLGLQLCLWHAEYTRLLERDLPAHEVLRADGVARSQARVRVQCHRLFSRPLDRGLHVQPHRGGREFDRTDLHRRALLRIGDHVRMQQSSLRQWRGRRAQLRHRGRRVPDGNDARAIVLGPTIG